jgi:DNA-binding NarL/FixJ family response regulator
MKAVIVEDHPLMRSALMEIIESAFPNALIEGFARLQAAKRWLQANPDCSLVVIDLTLPDAGPLAVVADLKADAPGAKLMVYSAESDPHRMREVIEQGAAGFVPKSASRHVVQQALLRVVAGHSYIPAELSSLNRAIASPQRPAPAAANSTGSLASQLGLTGRQGDVLTLILRGLPNKLICRHLSLAEGTVKVHVSAVLRVLGVRNRTEAVVAAARLGWRGD